MAVLDYPLTPQQQRMLDFIGGREDAYYLMLEPFAVEGPLDVAALATAVRAVLDRHDVLRAAFPAGSGTYRVLGSGVELFPAVWTDGGHYPSAAGALAAGSAAVLRPLALDTAPPLRIWHAVTGPEEHVVVMAGHHLVFDAWTQMLFYEDLAAEYARAVDGGPARPAPVQYAAARCEADESALAAWTDVFDLRYDGLRRFFATSERRGPAAVVRRDWPGLGARAARAAKAFSTTPYVVGAAAMLRALADLVGDDEVVLGSAYAGRMNAAATEALGYYSTSSFLGVDTSRHATGRDLVRAVADQLKRWHTSPRLQWEDLLDAYDAADLYPVKFALQPMSMAKRFLALPGTRTTRLDPPHAPAAARRPVDLIAAYDRDRVTATMTIRTDVLSVEDATRLIDGFARHLGALADEAEAA